MQFEWNREKAQKNFKKHNVSFEEAITVFYDPLSATFEDSENSISEQRYITIGNSSKNRLLVVSHTEVGNTIHIISARQATNHERKRHEE